MPTNTEALLQTLRRIGIRRIFAGSAAAAELIEPLLRSPAAASNTDQSALQLHIADAGHLAVNMAQGYFRASGTMGAVILDARQLTDDSLQDFQLASLQRTPMLLLLRSRDGRSTALPGSKWSQPLRIDHAIAPLISRAAAITRSEPIAPVCVSLPDAIMRARASRESAEFSVVRDIAPDPDSVNEVASALIAAEFPLLVTGSGGRDPRAFQLIETLSSQWAIPVAQPFASDANMSSSRTMNFGSEGINLLREADLIIVVEASEPWREQQPKAYAQVVQVGADPMYVNHPERNIRSSLSIAATPFRFFTALLNALGKRSTPVIAQRQKLLAELGSKRRARQQKAVQQTRADSSVDATWLAHSVNEAMTEDTLIINEAGVDADLLDITRPGGYIGLTADSPSGSATGLAQGARLAQPNRSIITITSELAYRSGNQLAVMNAARKMGLGTLTIINHPEADAEIIDSASTLPYEELIATCGGHGERIDNARDLTEAIRRGQTAAASGQMALLQVITRQG